MNINFICEGLELIRITCKKCGDIEYPLFECDIGHRYCQQCFQVYKKCPIDGSLLTAKDEAIEVDVVCKMCGFKTIYSEWENHYNVCDKIEVECESCKLMISKREMVEHEASKCYIRWNIECPFGCDTEGFSEIQLLNHRREKFQYHLDIAYSVITNYGLGKGFNSIDQRDSGGGSFEFYDTLMQDKINNIVEYSNFLTETNNLKEKVKLKRFEKKEEMRLLEKCIEDALLTSFNGKLVWLFNESSMEDSLRKSRIFYTGTYGYKLQLHIDRYGDEDIVSLVFLEGMYDPILKEEFQSSIKMGYKFRGENAAEFEDKVKTIDRTSRKTKITTIKHKLLEWIRFQIECNSDLDSFSSLSSMGKTYIS